MLSSIIIIYKKNIIALKQLKYGYKLWQRDKFVCIEPQQRSKLAFIVPDPQ